jgi:hypothetical protein
VVTGSIAAHTITKRCCAAVILCLSGVYALHCWEQTFRRLNIPAETNFNFQFLPELNCVTLLLSISQRRVPWRCTSHCTNQRYLDPFANVGTWAGFMVMGQVKKWLSLSRW